MGYAIIKDFHTRIAVIFFVLYTLWFIYLHLPGVSIGSQYDWFTATYGIIALWGSFWGFRIAKKWGWTSSIMGKSIIFFSLGLAFQELGQLTYTYYIYFLHVELPYPSLGDVFFISSVPCYSIAVILLGKVSGIHISLRSLVGKLQALLIPVGMVLASYLIFLQGHTVGFDDPSKNFFDFGYPLGDAIYISLALLTYALTKKVLGGIMKNRVLLVLIALLIQYLADWTFLYQASRGTWSVSGINDYIYLCAYFLMTVALLQMKTVLNKLGR